MGLPTLHWYNNGIGCAGVFCQGSTLRCCCSSCWLSTTLEIFCGRVVSMWIVKVVFATETLVAGINMPARSVVVSSLSKRIERGRTQLTANELLQMSGRAGHRGGIDKKGHVVLVQTVFEGAEECCEVLFSGLKPLVSQFTASYGMVLNLLDGAKITRGPSEADELSISRAGRTMEEAIKLVEQSFGNYVGSNVMIAAKKELKNIESEIEMLNS